MQTVRRITFPGASGHDLAARLDLPPGPPKAYALFAHCFTCGKDLRSATAIASNLTKAGFAVQLRFDFTGLGGSEGEFENTNFTSNVDDLIAAAAWLRERIPGTPTPRRPLARWRCGGGRRRSPPRGSGGGDDRGAVRLRPRQPAVRRLGRRDRASRFRRRRTGRAALHHHQATGRRSPFGAGDRGRQFDQAPAPRAALADRQHRRRRPRRRIVRCRTASAQFRLARRCRPPAQPADRRGLRSPDDRHLRRALSRRRERGAGAAARLGPGRRERGGPGRVLEPRGRGRTPVPRRRTRVRRRLRRRPEPLRPARGCPGGVHLDDAPDVRRPQGDARRACHRSGSSTTRSISTTPGSWSTGAPARSTGSGG